MGLIRAGVAVSLNKKVGVKKNEEGERWGGGGALKIGESLIFNKHLLNILN